MIVPLTYEEWLTLRQTDPDLEPLPAIANPDCWDFYVTLRNDMSIASFGRCLKEVQ